jgi:asparagine synthase (glutamine-hydrolysing)
MLGTMRHESFYSASSWSQPSEGVYVGWTTRGEEPSGGKPLTNETNDVLIVFSGEEYSDPAVMQGLRERGHRFTDANCSYLPHLYEENSEFLAALNGRFHGVLSDTRSGSVVLFNDRYAMHRLYYHVGQNVVYFAAEAKAILEVCPDLRRQDMQSLGELVRCGCVLENRTIFQGIGVLPPGSAWRFHAGKLEAKSFYFQASEWEQQGQLDADQYYEQLKDAFTKCLPRYLSSPEKIAVSLTGGLDTRAVMAWQRAAPRALPCYTYGETGHDCRDVVVARQVALACGQPHQVIRVGEEFFRNFAHYAERSIYLTDGCVDVGRAADLYLSERARKIAPVRMTGLYGDEVLRPQVRAFKPMRMYTGVFDAELQKHMDGAAVTYAELTRCDPVSFTAFRQTPWYHFGILSLEQTQLTVRTPFLDNGVVSTAFRSPESVRLNNDLRVRLIGDGSTSLKNIPTDRGFGGNANSLWAQAYQAYLEFTFKAEYAYDYGMPQWLAKADHMVAPLQLQRLFLGRHKLYHYRVWYRDILAQYVREMLLDAQSLARPWVARRQVEEAVHGHLKGNRNFTTEIHRLLTLEIIHRFFFD